MNIFRRALFSTTFCVCMFVMEKYRKYIFIKHFETVCGVVFKVEELYFGDLPNTSSLRSEISGNLKKRNMAQLHFHQHSTQPCLESLKACPHWTPNTLHPHWMRIEPIRIEWALSQSTSRGGLNPLRTESAMHTGIRIANFVLYMCEHGAKLLEQ